MTSNTKRPAPPRHPKRHYRTPSLVAFGKVHALVAGGSGAQVEGMLMIAIMRRP